MTPRRSPELEQRLIDHEVRISEAHEAAHRYAASREARRERQSSQAERRWYRGQLIAMLAAARTEADLHGLGLSDDVVREARLGDSLAEAWARFRPQHLPPPGYLSGPGERAHPVTTRP